MKSIKPRKQRKMLYNAPLHTKRKWLASHLSENLLLKYDKRSIPVIKGDTVKVMRGSYRGHEDKVVQVNVKKQTVEIEGVMTVKADGKKIAKSLHPSNLLITKLNLTDKWRRNKLERGLSEETKKEIEAEAEQQLKDLEVERKKAEEEAQKELEEQEKIKDEELQTIEEPTPQPPSTPPAEDKKTDTTKKEQPEKPKTTSTTKKTKPSAAPKKPATKKTPAKKKKETEDKK